MDLSFRQVHLDFHTSPEIPDVAVNFNAEEFAQTLKESEVESVTVFAKCHHGYSYYPTEVGTKHPSLDRDLLEEMISACHKEGIRVPVYTTVVWDELAAENSDWRQINKEGELVGRDPLSGEDNGQDNGWKWLCMNSPYMDHLIEHTEEIVKNYDLDGIFFDIVFQTRPGCVCSHCLQSMEKLNLNPEKEEDLLEHSLMIERKAMDRLYETVTNLKPDISIFFNGRTRLDQLVQRGIRPELKYFTHFEIESLPSGIWGYNHFPLYSSFYKNLNMDFLGHTGKFHKMWGDFGGLKNQKALEYECFLMLANGAKCLIGDQMHPRGELDKATYELIGNVYNEVKRKENWADKVTPVAEIGVMISMNPKGGANEPSSLSDEGAMQMLSESQIPFIFVDESSDLKDLNLIIIPDKVVFKDSTAHKINEFIQNGGKVIFSHESGLDERKEFILDTSLEYEGKLDYSPDFIDMTQEVASMTNYKQVAYEQGSKVRANDSNILSKIFNPYFNRTWKHYMSHRHTPVDCESEFPAVVKENDTIYFAHPIFEMYRTHGNYAYKHLIQNSINSLLEERMIYTNLPSTAQLTINDQFELNRRVIHILHYTPQKRSLEIDIIEDAIPLHQITIEHKTKLPPSEIYLAPSKEVLDFTYEDGYVKTVIPTVDGHEMLVFQF